MHRQQIITLNITVVLILFYLVGCGSGTPTTDPEAGGTEPTAASIATAPVTSDMAPTAATSTTAPALADTDAQPGASGLGDSFYPGFGNGGYDVQHYTLDLTISDVEANALDGLATLTATASQSLSSFNLDFIGFTIDSITVNGQPATFGRQEQELTVTPSQPLAAGETFEAQITYSGQPEEVESVAAEGLIGWVAYDDDGSFVLSQPDGAATYYPVNDHPLDKASYTFRVTVPKPFMVAANGVLEETIDQGDMTTYVWEAYQPMASYLTTVNIGEFDLEMEQSPDGTPIRNYYAVSLADTDDAREPFRRQGEMLALYSDIFGPYPFDVYGSIVLDTEVGTALEAQTLSIYGIDQLDLDDLPLAEQLVAHELAHQWFGDSLSVADWGDIWLNEGFATYAEGLWIEETEGAEALDEWVIDTYWYVVEAGDDFVVPGAPPADDLFNEGVYCRGALTLHALRLEVGDDLFFDILATYYDRFQGGNVTTADFIGVAEELSGQDLTAVFDDWLYGAELPPIPELELADES